MDTWGREDRLAGNDPPEQSDGADSEQATDGTDSHHRSTWVTWLFPSSEFGAVLRRSALLSLGFFVAGWLLSVAVGVGGAYLDPRTFLGLSAVMGTVGVLIELVIVGQWSSAYARIWDDAVDCFAAEARPRYHALVDRHLDRMYRARRDRVYDVKLVVLAFLLVEPPFALVVNGLNPFVGGHLVLIYLNAVLVLLGLTALFLFLTHLRLVAALGELELRNLHTAARELEPIAGLSVSVAVSWFAGVTVLSVYYWLDYGAFLWTPVTSGGETVPLDLAVHLLLVSTLVVVGFLVFAVPLWLMHLHITSGKRTLVDSLDERRNELLRGWTSGSAAEPDIVDELDVLESIQQSTDRIRTWPYFVSDLVALALSALVPVAQIVFLVL